ncbi:MAG TPA: hypothetical protein VKU19_19200 [Bryobacteraceae bacterium]|nr:hypothetical protein [Bryobacteraceae bacterium]
MEKDAIGGQSPLDIETRVAGLEENLDTVVGVVGGLTGIVKDMAHDVKELFLGVKDLAGGVRELSQGAKELLGGVRELSQGLRELAQDQKEFKLDTEERFRRLEALQAENQEKLNVLIQIVDEWIRRQTASNASEARGEKEIL